MQSIQEIMTLTGMTEDEKMTVYETWESKKAKKPKCAERKNKLAVS